MTIREVAKRAGVSLQTVSNVLNGRTSQMGDETRKRVLETIKELGYYPNAHARGLRSQRTRTLGYLTLDPSARFLSDPFHVAILSGMGDRLREQDYSLLVQALDPEQPEETFNQLFLQRRLDGAVVHLSGSQALRRRCVQQWTKSGHPFVLIEEKAKGPNCACVMAANRKGAERAVEHLVAKGHQQIGFLLPERGWPAVEERLEGYKDALQALTGSEPRWWTVESEQVEAARATMDAVLKREKKLTAVICSNDVLGLGALQAAKALGRRIPTEFAIVGFDDFEFARFVEPPLTTVALPGYEMGRRAVELLLEHLEQKGFTETEISFATRLIERGTT
ncbi:MAG: LacI family DNA-binding transcriptional regulator [Gemmataceae bacterium]